VPRLGAPVLDLLAPQPGERILDLGCGDGVLTHELVTAGAVVTGIDASPEMIAAARARGLDAHVIAGQDLAENQAYDAVFSNAALHWMTQPERVAANVFRALRPGGRFVAEFGGFGNTAAVQTATYAVLARRGVDGASRNPWYFPSVEDYRAVLENAGLSVEQIALIPRSTQLNGPLADWLELFAQSLLDGFAGVERKAITEEVEALLRPILRDSKGVWFVDYVRLRFAARRPA
jgi:trans-aconitate methyltransferase